MNKVPSLESLIPHRRPMLLLDSIVSINEQEIITKKTIEADSFFLEGHYPHFPLVPGVITCECIFQAGAALISHKMGQTLELKNVVPVIARIENARFRDVILPGQTVFFSARFKEQMAHVFFMKGDAKVDGKLMASVEFSCVLKVEE